MKSKTKNTLVFLFSLLLAGGVFLWFFPLNKGTLELKTGIRDYRVFVDGKELPCKEDPCATRLQAGLHQLLIQKDDYRSFFQNVVIERGKTETVEVPLERVYTLIPSSFVFSDAGLPTPELPTSLLDKIIASTWNQAKNRLVFLDRTDQKLKTLDTQKKEEKVITALQGIAAPLQMSWSPDEKSLVAYQNQDIYFISIKEGARKKKVLNFKIKEALWSPLNTYIFLTDSEDQLYKADFATLNLVKQDLTASLIQAAWINDETLIYLKPKAEGGVVSTEIWTYQPEKKFSELLTAGLGKNLTKLKVDPANKKVYFEDQEKAVYEVNL